MDDAALEEALDSNPDASQLLEQSSDLVSSLRVRQSLRTLTQTRKSLVGKSRQFGKERVNCITLWFPPTTLEPCGGAYDEPVAVLANNDKSVAVVGLHTQEVQSKIEYPDCVNRAVCSPDGRLLIAVSDDPYLYVHERAAVDRHTNEPLGPAHKPVCRWTERNKIHLISQSKEDRSDNRGSFAACFSSSGRYLAVGTQYGAISIFDTTTITDPDVVSLVTSFTSSRPNDTLGAVRAMEFAPGPVDLLAWTEDRGRVGVADLRDACISRQILYLDKEDDYDHISLSDRGSIDPRLLENRRNDRGHNSSLDPTSNADLAEMSRQPTAGADADIERLNQPLTAEETRVLEALQEHSRRRDERAALRSQRLLGSERASDSPRARPATTTDIARAESNAIVSQAVNDVLGSIRDLRDQRERLRETREVREARERGDRLDQLRDAVAMQRTFLRTVPSETPTASLDRLRDEVALQRSAMQSVRGGSGWRRAPSSSSLLRPSSSSSSPTIAPAGTEEALSARRALQARLMGGDGAGAQPPTGSAWSDLEALWNLSFDAPTASAALDSGGFHQLNLRVDPEVRRRDRSAFLTREWDGTPARRLSMGLGLRHSAADPFDTAGLAWSEDGRKL